MPTAEAPATAVRNNCRALGNTGMSVFYRDTERGNVIDSQAMRWFLLGCLALACTKKPPHPIDPQPPVTLPGNVVVQTLRAGDGAGAIKGDKISIHFVGTLEDGGVFDSSRARGTPFAFWVGEGQVLPGLDEALLGMHEGEMRRVTVPPAMGYGTEAKPNIPPNSTLRFEVELLDIR
jgi:FKBP-type peptidyl-prolyl cis-trans isomerase